MASKWNLAGVLLGVTSLGCETEGSKECRRQAALAQEVVLNVQASSADSVGKSLAAVEQAAAACAAAERAREHEELVKAKNQLAGHLEYLRRKAQTQKQEKLTPEQVASLVKLGDKTCPKGQAYKHGGSGKEIRCIGPQIVDMSKSEASSYFEGRGYKLLAAEPSTVKAEYGAELFVFDYGGVGEGQPPRCVTLFPPPGMSFQEAVARATGLPPDRVKPDSDVTTGRGPLSLRIEDDEAKTVIRIGNCG